VSNGDLSYPEYKIEKKEVIYHTRKDLVDFAEACHLESQVLTAIEKKNHSLISDKLVPTILDLFSAFIKSDAMTRVKALPLYLRNQTAGHILTRCLSHTVSSLEQSKDHSKAIDILTRLLDQNCFCHPYRGKWYERIIIDEERHLKNPSGAVNAIVIGLQDDLVTSYMKFDLYSRAKKMMTGKKPLLKGNQIPKSVREEYLDVEKCRKVTIECPTLKKPLQGRRCLFTNSDGTSIMRVEDVAMDHYKKTQGYSHGLHSESVVYHALLNVLLWDVIYTPLPDAFRFQHQNLPLDFTSSEHFYSRRKDVISERFESLKKMSKSQVDSEIDRIWSRYYGTACLVSWDNLDSNTLKQLVFCIGINVLLSIFERMLSNFRLNRSGFPDLIVWDPSFKKVKAIEVKGPGDSLSGKQVLWLDFFTSCGLPCEVCFVKAKSKE